MRDSNIAVFAENNLHQFYDAVLGELDSVHLCSCEAAFDWWRQGSAEIAVIDCGHRVETGLDLVRFVKKASPRAIVIFIAEVSTEKTVIEAFTAGVRNYLRKPFSVPEFQKLVRNLLAAKARSKEKRVPIKFAENPSANGMLDVKTDKPVQLLRALRHMKENLTNRLDLNACAKEAGLSKYHFCRAFKGHFGMTPMRFLQLLRVNRAKDLMLQDYLNLGEIASMVGFSEERSFSQAFKKFVGVGPRDYRNSIRKSL